MPRAVLVAWMVITWQGSLFAADDSKAHELQPAFVHLRNGSVREWSEFPENSPGPELQIHFPAQANDAELALSITQQDVKQGWNVLLNGKRLGELVRDENAMRVYFSIPAGMLVQGDNALKIEAASRASQVSDDIRVGQIRLEWQPTSQFLRVATVDIHVVDRAQNKPTPCRITVVDRDGVLQSVGANSNDQLAVRPGTVYAAGGVATFGLPPGQYVVYAGRGFEYSLAKTEVTLVAGETVQRTLAIEREVPTEGYIACDTHVHTLTHSGHGDATITERLITIAGEGIELPIATDHNVHIDYEPLARKLGVRQHFTPVMGNEVTTTVGHFNVFPVSADARVADHRKKEWGPIFEEIFQTPGVRVAVLNHARDLHSGVRPFGPKLHHGAAGENLHGWPMRFNAMEVVNSGAVQSDVLQLFHDWMAVLNRGYRVTPVGSSDSHDVARHFVGQGRTYIRGADRRSDQIDVQSAVANFLQGHVMVSYGLMTELTIGGQYRSGDLAPSSAGGADDQLPIELRILGPHWTRADRVRLYVNGMLLREESVPESRGKQLTKGVLWQGTWKVPRPKQDVHFVAIGLGPGITESYWKTAKPYQPTSPDWQPVVLGCSGATWFDGDGDGKLSAARDYAERAYAGTDGDIIKLVKRLDTYDVATAVQALHLFRSSGKSLDSPEYMQAISAAPPHVQTAFGLYRKGLRDHELAFSFPD